MFSYNFLDNRPPTLYSILDSICNFDTENKSKISELAKNSREKIFDFDYPLSDKIKKEDFETMLLNKFLMRRIGYETMTAFKIQLYVKLNEIMPNYNLLFDAIDKWNLFKDGEIITRTLDDSRTVEDIGTKTSEITENKTTENTNNINSKIESQSGTISSNTTDNRYSELPQSELENVQDANYMTQYTLTKNDNSVDDNSVSNQESDSTENRTEDLTNNKSENTNNNKTENIKIIEEISKSPNKKLEIYNNFIKEKNNIYTMIFKDLECLFYQLV